MIAQTTILSDDDLMETVETVKQAGSMRKAAEVLGINESTVRRRMKVATSRKLTGEFLGGKLPEGYVLGKVTSLVSADGTKAMEWQHQHPTLEALQDQIAEMIDAMRADITPLPLVDMTMTATDAQLLTVYPVTDVHLGQFSWGKETGENYDLKIAVSQFHAAVTDLVSQSPNSGSAIIAVLGDFFHADNNDATTSKSKNHLDVDGRHDKVLHAGVELIIWMIDLALQKHEHVLVHVTPGNHDEYASKALGTALYFRYQGNPRVKIDRDPHDLWTYQWGANMLAFAHGHKVKAEDMPGVMASQEPVMWGQTKYRYAYSGHYHRSKAGPVRDEKHGAIWEILPAFTAKDAWNRSMGHNSLRSIMSKTFSFGTGLKYTTQVQI